MRKIVPVILSGGVGSRLWPVSRTLYPKQLQPLFSERSMLVETVGRIQGEMFAPPVVVCNNEHRFIIAEQLKEAGLPTAEIILEPVGRNTASAAAVAALVLEGRAPGTMMLLMPSDHLVLKQANFLRACEQASAAANDGALATFGIVPNEPNTGYGYIRKGASVGDWDGCFEIQKFVEKPELERAEEYLADGEYYWNSGMFLFSASAYLEELKRLKPDVYDLSRQAVAHGRRDMDFFRLDEQAFGAIEGISIDYAVMEHTRRAAVVPVDMGWSDVGSWSALWNVGEKDGQGNVVLGDVLVRDVSGSYLRSTGPLVAAIGVHDVIVVATEDAVLVAPKDRSQEVKDVVAAIQEDRRAEHLSHKRVYRPWGWYQCVDASSNFQVKRLMIKPGGVLSLQVHQRRAEHWVVVSGTASVIRGDEAITLNVNESTDIRAGMKHRLENKGSEPLHIIEVQSGDYLGEDDIERFEDLYGRN